MIKNYKWFASLMFIIFLVMGTNFGAIAQDATSSPSVTSPGSVKSPNHSTTTDAQTQQQSQPAQQPTQEPSKKKGAKEIDVPEVKVPEKPIRDPTPEEVHQESAHILECSTCHSQKEADTGISIKPMNHFLTTKDCKECHFNKTWIPLRYYNHLTPKYKNSPANLECTACHTSNTEFRALTSPQD